ncbi:MAG TPA: tRNA (adenosine(37)-N6)-dimethylallyltransferase MiaA [Crocinitomix sp.]|nr:tRNA (adenosine(37)-N6)-dimethylallyltransferase MiaA [Crocinitomix sp.]
MTKKTKYLIIIVGPTAVGKTALSIELAQKYNASILSFDSRQFYKEMCIGTAKPNANELAQAKHYFIDSHSINENYTSGKFEIEALKTLNQIYKTNDICIAVGGSGLYINALVYGIDKMPSDLNIRQKFINLHLKEGLKPLQDYLDKHNPEVFEFIDRNNHARMIRAIEVIEVSGKKFTSFRKNKAKPRNFIPIWIGLEMDRELLYNRISLRVDLMLETGLENEAKSLIKYKHHSALKTVGYSEFFSYFDNKIDFEECVRLIKRNSRRYAKKQFTWFKKNEHIKWFDTNNKADIYNYLNKALENIN